MGPGTQAVIYRAYYVSEHAVSSIAVDVATASTHCAYPGQIDNYIFHENSQKVDEHFSLFFVKILRKLWSHLLVIIRENMVHNKIKT